MASNPQKVKKVKPAPPESYDREMELTEHLGELRTRIIHAVVYACIGMAVAWVFYEPLNDLLTGPLQSLKQGKDFTIVFHGFMEPFFLRLQVSAVAGLILMFPFLFKEAWGFISPALTHNERRAFYLIGPLCVSLFLMGVVCAFFVIPRGIAFFLSFVPPGTQLMQRLNDYILFLVKSALAFGIAFQLPVVILFLGKVGIVNSKFLIKYWRQAIVISAAAAALITPSVDAFTMLAMMAPLTILYALSIFLVKLVEKERKDEEEETAEE